MKLKFIFAAMTALVAVACNNQPKTSAPDITGPADKIVYGNIITMDARKMRAEAMTIKNGAVQYVGSKETAEALCGDSTVREDYGSATVYPGFIDVHVHPLTAGQRRMESVDFVGATSLEEYLQRVREFIAAHPDNTDYKGAGWSPVERELTAKDLDEICADKPMLFNSIDGHSFWMNTIALKNYGFTREAAAEDGPAQIHVDADGNPSGVVVEENERIAKNSHPSVESEMEAITLWQDFAFSLGFTSVGDAGFGVAADLEAYRRLDSEGRLKLQTYASYYQPIPGQSVEDKVAKTLEAKAKYEGEYFRIPGIKMFVDGVIEGHTAWVLEDYLDQPGFTGVKKLEDHDYLVSLVKTANENGLYVHLHTIGDGAVKFTLDAIEDAQKASRIYNARNCMAHLQLVRPEDVKRFADNNVIAIVAPMWTPYDETVTPLEIKYVGEERVKNAYPIRSFLEEGATIAFHSDYPVSTAVSIPKSVYYAVTRCNAGMPDRKAEEEGITRLDAMKAMTTSAAYALGDDTIGSLEIGKKANYSVFDADFLSDPLEKIFDASTIATAVRGEVVFKHQ